jgi:hypothetical protein
MTQPPHPDTTTPKLKKGLLVEVVHGVEGVRTVTSAELDHWRAERKRLGDWFDDAGESRLPPRYNTDSFSVGRKFTVLRAIVSTKDLWYGRSHQKYALVLCTQTGHEYYVNKAYLRAV